MTAFRTRFAPSPTGQLHLGHAASARYVWEAAEQRQGEVLLRIEDIDTTRCRPEYTTAIYDVLSWLGFDWPKPVHIQSNHFDAYAKVVHTLRTRGLAYRCFKSRAEIAAETKTGQPFTGKSLPASEEKARLEDSAPFAWRLSLASAEAELGPLYRALTYQVMEGGDLKTSAAHPGLHGDIVLARKDSPSAYHVAATHDDALQGITHVIRGEDLIDAPHIQTLLQTLMGWPRPIYQHHPLVLGPDGKRLSKTDKSVALAELRAGGMDADEVWRRAGFHDK